jgi:HEAT repeat protein
MSHFCPLRTLRAALVTLAVAFMFLAVRTAVAVPPADPVEELRLALKPGLDERNQAAKDYRAEILEKRINALKTLSDLRRGLSLTEWKDSSGPTVAIRQIDTEARTKVGNRLTAAIKAVVEKGNSAHPGVATARLAVAKMIGEMGIDVRALNADDQRGFARSLTPYLIRLMKDRNPDVRAAAARALGQVFPDPAVAGPALKAMLQSDGVEQRRAAAAGLVSMVQKVSDLENTGRGQTGIQAGRKDVLDADTAVMEAAGPGLADRDTETRALAVDAVLKALQSFRGQVPDALDPNDFPPRDRKKLTAAELSAIVTANKQQRMREQDFAPLIKAISRHGPALARLLSDRDARVRFDARKALEYIGELRLRLRRLADSIPPLPPGQELGAEAAVLPIAQKEGADKDDPLGRALDPGLQFLARGLKDPNPRIRLATVEFLETLGDGAVSAVPALLEALEDCDRFVRWAAARTFGRMDLDELGPRRERIIVPAIARLLFDPDVDVCKTAAGTLQRFGPQAAAAVPSLARVTAQGDPEVRVAAMQALGALNPEDAVRAVRALLNALRNADADVRRTAAETLGRIGPLARDAIGPLRQALQDDNPAVRRAASDALLSILPPADEAGM